MAQIPIAQVTPYAAADVDMTLRLVDPLEQPLRQNDRLRRIFDTLELPLIYVLKDMELAGIKLDIEALGQTSQKLAGRRGELEAEIQQLAGLAFNINSTQQLSDVLFGKLGLPTEGLKKTKSGHCSTAAGVLESLQGQHQIIDLILEQRTLAKLQSTLQHELLGVPRLSQRLRRWRHGAARFAAGDARELRDRGEGEQEQAHRGDRSAALVRPGLRRCSPHARVGRIEQLPGSRPAQSAAVTGYVVANGNGPYPFQLEVVAEPSGGNDTVALTVGDAVGFVTEFGFSYTASGPLVAGDLIGTRTPPSQ